MNSLGVVRTFANESRLIEWLEDRKSDMGSHDSFREWLSDYYIEGNKIEVCGITYSFLDCLRLI